ncbi:hypothetical protein AK88_01763 [Plasmodium fragile]|uniref:Uncharacterized protein n=1 Tax=Plasmodium fragile TaxID=5857 RepID=A0A0D9QN50_PLAFR|nr:uncharacterized protein AK88_01763 [Plasmodium fragile]KJP88484.1 hypothetical protein AK88_01763 [Plasmodium fragile]
MGKTHAGRRCTPWKNVRTLKNCDADLLFCHDLTKSVQHKFVFFALNLLCVSKKYELVFITYGQYIYVYELKNFLENNININVDVNPNPNVAVGVEPRNENGRDNVIANFYKQEISQNDSSFKNINKIKYVYDEVKNDLSLKAMNIPAPTLILSPHVYSKGYVNIKCEERDNSDKSLLISVGWSEDTSVYYVQKIVECINIKKKLKHILEQRLFDLKRYDDNETTEAIYFNDTHVPPCVDSVFPTSFRDSYRLLNKLKIDEHDFILSLIHNNRYANGYSKELLEMFELSKCINNFDHIKNKAKQRRSARMYRMQLKNESTVHKRKKRLNDRAFNLHVTSNLKKPLLKTKKINVCKNGFYKTCLFERETRGVVSGAVIGGAGVCRNAGALTVYQKNAFKKGPYKMKYICLLRCPRDEPMGNPKSDSAQNPNTRSNINGNKKKFKISEIYSSLESAEEDAYDADDGREDGWLNLHDNHRMRKKTAGQNFTKNHQVNYVLGNDAKEIEELNFYTKMRNNVYMGYNQRNNLMRLNDQNEYINAIRDETEFVNTYIKSSSDEECTGHLSSKLRLNNCSRKGSGPKFYRHGDLRMTLRRGLHMAQLMAQRKIKRVAKNKKRVRDDDNMDMCCGSNRRGCVGGAGGRFSPNACYRGRAKIGIKRKRKKRKKYHGDEKKTQIERLRRNIKNYNLHVERLNILKKERKKFVNFCKLYITHVHYEEFSNKLENFLDPSVDIKYNKIWKQFNIFSFNLFNVDYNDKILKSSHIYVQPDIVFNNKTYIQSDTSTWAISFNFTKNLLAIGSNTHNINIYNLNNFYYFRRRYDYDDALNFFKNAFVHRKVKVNRLFVNNDKDPFYFDSTDAEEDHLGKNRKSKKREKEAEKKRKRKKKKDTTEEKHEIRENKKKNNHFSPHHHGRDKTCDHIICVDHCEGSEESSTSVSASEQANRKGDKRYQPNGCHSPKVKKKRKKRKEKKNKNDSVIFRNEYINHKDSTSSGLPSSNLSWEEEVGHKRHSITNGEEEPIHFYSSESAPLDKWKDDYLLHLQDGEDISTCAADQAARNNSSRDGQDKADLHMASIPQAKDPMRGICPMKNKSYVTKISVKDRFKEANLHKALSSIMHRRSYIPIDLAQFFLNRKENLKKMLLTLSYNFPSDAIILFLKQASIGAQIYHMKWNIHCNIALTIHKMKKLYAKRFGSKYCRNLKLFHPQMVIINNNKYLKNWYIKFLRRSMSRYGVRGAHVINKILKRGKKRKTNWAKGAHGERRHNYLDILKGEHVVERTPNADLPNGERSLEGPPSQHTPGEAIDAAKADSGSASTTSEDEVGVHNIIYRKTKSYNMSKVERIYVLCDPPSAFQKGQNGRLRNTNVDVHEDNVIKCHKHLYSYKRANNVLKNISRRFRKFIKERHKFTFSYTKPLFSNEHSIFVVLDKRRNKGELHCYDRVAGKYVEELKMVVKSIQRHSVAGLFLKTHGAIPTGEATEEKAGASVEVNGAAEAAKSFNGEEDPMSEQRTVEQEVNFDFYNKTILVVCELKDHNNNTLDIMHLTNDPIESGPNFVEDEQPGTTKEDRSNYYSLRFDECGAVKGKKQRMQRNVQPRSSSDASSRSGSGRGSSPLSSNAEKTKTKKTKKKKKKKGCLRNVMAGKAHMNGIVNYTIEMELDNLYRNNRPKEDKKEEMKVKRVMNNLLLNLKAESGSNSSESANISEGSMHSRGINFPAYINNNTSQSTNNFNRFINEGFLSTARSRLLGNGYNSDFSNNGLLVRALHNYRMVRSNVLHNMRNNIRNNRPNRPNRSNRSNRNGAGNVPDMREDFMNESTQRVLNNMVNATQNILNINNSIGNITGRPPLTIRGRRSYYTSRAVTQQASNLNNNENLINLDGPSAVDSAASVARPNEDSESEERPDLEDSQLDNQTSGESMHLPRVGIEDTRTEGRGTPINSYASIIIRNLLASNPDRIEAIQDGWRFRINTSSLDNIYLISRASANTNTNNSTSSVDNNADSRNSRNSRDGRQQNEHLFLNVLYNNILNMRESNRNNSSSLAPNVGNWTSNVMNNSQNNSRNLNQEYNSRRNLRNTFFNELDSFTGKISPMMLDLMNNKNSENVKMEGEQGTMQCCMRFREIPFGLKSASMNDKYDAIVRYVYTLPQSADEIMLTHGSKSDSFFDFVIVCEGVCEKNERVDRGNRAKEAPDEEGRPAWDMDDSQEVALNMGDAVAAVAAAESDRLHGMLGEEGTDEETDQMTEEQDEEYADEEEEDEEEDDEEEGEADESEDEIIEEPTGDVANDQIDHHGNADDSAMEEPLGESRSSGSHKTNPSQWSIVKDSLRKDSVTGDVRPGGMALECAERDSPRREAEEYSKKVSHSSDNNVTDMKPNLSSASTLDMEDSSYESYYSSCSNTTSDFSNISECLVDECSECENLDLCFEGSNIINFNSAYRFLKYEGSKLYINNCSVSIKKNRDSRLSKYCLKRKVAHPTKESCYQGGNGHNECTQIVALGVNDFENSSTHLNKEKGPIRDEEEYEPLWMTNWDKDTPKWKEKPCKDKVIITSKWLHKVLLQQNCYLNEEKRNKLEMVLKGQRMMEDEQNRGEKDQTSEQTNKGTHKKKKKKKHVKQDKPIKKQIEYLNVLRRDENNESDKSNALKKDRFFNTFLKYYYSTIKEDKGERKKKRKNIYTGDGSKMKKKYYDYNVSALVQYKAEQVRNSLYNDKNANYMFKYLPKNMITRKFCNKVRMSPSYDESNRMSEVLWTFSNVTFYSADWYDIMYKLFFELSSRFYEIIVKHHKHNIPCVKFSPDDNFLLSCSVDRSLVLWNPFNVKNYDLDRNYNIYDHVFPPREDRKSRERHRNVSVVREKERRKLKKQKSHHRMSFSLLVNETVQINYGGKRSAFEKVFHESKIYKSIREKELLSNMKKNNILCKQEMKHMGWSGDFLLKKNIPKCDILTDLFYKENFFIGQRPSFNYCLYFPAGNVAMDNFCPFFQKYSFFQLFSCSFFSAKGNIQGGNLHSLRSYLYKRNMKRTEYVQPNNIQTIFNIMTDKNVKAASFSKKKMKQIYSTMKYVCKNLLKSYIVVYPLKYEERICDLESVKLTRQRLTRDVCVLTDYEYGHYANMVTSTWNDARATPGWTEDFCIKSSRTKKDKTKKKYYTRRENKRKNKKQKGKSSLIESESNNESDDSWETDVHSSSSCVEPDKKNWKCAKASDYNTEEGSDDYDEDDEDDDELDADYQKRKKHEKSLFYKYIRGIRNDFSLHFLSGKRKNYEENPKKWIPLFEKLIHQYADLKFCKSMYRHVTCKVLSDCIAKFEASKPKLYFNFHITANYQESKILSELLQNYAVYFGSVGAGSGTSVEMNQQFQSYLTLIKRTGRLGGGSGNKQGETEEESPEMHSKNVGYTIILKNNISNFHNVINNIVNISHSNRIINHHKYFRENNMYQKHTREAGMADHTEKRSGNTKHDSKKSLLENLFDDLENESTDFCSSDSLNSDANCGKGKRGKMSKLKMKRNERDGKRNGSTPRRKDLEDVLRREDKVYNICFLNARNDNYKIKYFENINVLQNMYRYCGKGLLVVNVKYVTDEDPEDVSYTGGSSPMGDDPNKRGSVIFQTDIHICSEKKTKKRNKNEIEKKVHYKKAKTIIFIIRVNLHELRNYQRRKIIFEEKYVKSTFYINLKVMKLFYQIALKNCKLLHKTEHEEHDEKVNAEKKKILKSFYVKERYSFLVYLTKNLFQRRKKYPLTPRRICKYIVWIRNIILDTRLFDHYENCNSDLPQVQSDYRFLYSLNLDLPKKTTLFKLFFLLLPKRKRDMIMLNISMLRFLYSHLSRDWKKRGIHFTYGEKRVRKEEQKKKKNKTCSCVKKPQATFNSVVDREEKKQLSKYIILSADKHKLYLSKIKFTKITKNFFTTRFVRILELNKPVEPKLPAAYKSSRINLLKIIYDKSCIVLANQYSNLIFVYFAHKCVYTNSYFLIPYFTIPLYTERIGRALIPNFSKDVCIGDRKRLVNNINYNFRKILADNYKDMDEELNFFIAGLDVIYLKGKKNDFELNVFAILLNNILFCYKLNFQYY